jgi:two-component system, sensor histidine kinase and response regulator
VTTRAAPFATGHQAGCVAQGNSGRPPTDAAATHLEQRLAYNCSGMRLLLAEDNPVNQDVVRELLQDTGLIVDAADNGAGALALAQRHRYHVVLMDIQMPTMDGIAATGHLRELPGWEHVPIIALTANASAEDRVRYKQAGMNDHVAKPVVPETLYRTLMKWLPTNRSGADSRSHQASAVPSPTNPVSDIEVQQRLERIVGLDVVQGMLSVRNRLSTYIRLLSKYALSHAHDMVAVRQQLAEGNFDAARRLAHSLKGVSATLGATQVRSQALELEVAIGEQWEPKRIEACVVSVEAVLAPLVAALGEAIPS